MYLRNLVPLRYYSSSRSLRRIVRPRVPEQDPFEDKLDPELHPIVRLFLKGEKNEAKAAIDKFLLFHPSNVPALHLNFWICYKLRETKAKPSMTDIENFPTLVLRPKIDADELNEETENDFAPNSFDAHCRNIHTKLWNIADDQNPLSYSLGLFFESFGGSPKLSFNIYKSLRAKIPSFKVRTLNRLAIIAYSDDLSYPRHIAAATSPKEMFLAYRNQYLETQLTPSDLELICQSNFKPQETTFKSSLQDVNQIIFSHLSKLKRFNEQKEEWSKVIATMSETQIPELEARFIPSPEVRSVVAAMNKYLHVVFAADEYRDFYAIQKAQLWSAIGEHREAENVIHSLEASPSTLPPDTAIAIAKYLLVPHDKISEALNYIELSLKNYPSDFLLNYYRTAYLLELRRSEEGLRSANQTLEILASPFALGQRALAFAQLGKHDKVLEILSEIVDASIQQYALELILTSTDNPEPALYYIQNLPTAAFHSASTIAVDILKRHATQHRLQVLSLLSHILKNDNVLNYDALVTIEKLHYELIHQ
jgi:tetratricopeptide (TPR) repeat protein